MGTTYFTVYDKNYAARGLTMLESLVGNCHGKPRTVVLALDDDAYRVSLGKADAILRPEDLGDDDFIAAKATRSHEEFCWTCAPVLSDYILRTSKSGSLIAYLDADLMFYADPKVLLDELGDYKNIIIHEHRFSPDRREWERTAGRFNVGFVGFRVSEEAGRCTARWRQQVLDLCVKDPDRGLCGDQGYLNEWPDLYPGLRIMQNIGGGVAPWNVTTYKVSGLRRRPMVDGVGVVFFHFHQLRIIDNGGRRFFGAICATGYDFSSEIRSIIYAPYLRKLRDAAMRLVEAGIPLRSDSNFDDETFRHYILTRHVDLVGSVIGGLRYKYLTLPAKRGADLGRRVIRRGLPASIKRSLTSAVRRR
ncbi:hypothetical protein HFO06_11160 [Rhizobium leguminosarum]|uniref:hypothetical protein n=1 Tax=Rhizobium leguminosarum TaxID=384 RepID=UPI001C98E40F|nr:hypothetical protein [Rhizobium leguminosarum]MBY5763647.1 hypothetical protein [Rhizobium leguminosarum]